jgi:release factor glutamine methyltransferase
MNDDLKTIKDIRNHFFEVLKDIYPENEINSITSLAFKTLFGIDRLHLHLDQEIDFPEDKRGKMIKIAEELKTGKPIQYILGETFFYNLKFRVTPATLIPRPETEELVDLIINDNQNFRGKIIDIGTGSGCIAICLKKNLENAEITGTDISEEALTIARENAFLNKADVLFTNQNIFQMQNTELPVFSMIVSNPPYVLDSEKHNMWNNVLDFEPPTALFVPDNDPLIYYRAIISFSSGKLENGGKIYLEINEKKGDEIYRLLDQSGFKEIQLIKDINGKDRFVKGIKNER